VSREREREREINDKLRRKKLNALQSELLKAVKMKQYHFKILSFFLIKEEKISSLTITLDGHRYLSIS